jgi:hydrogenase 3 maturation protease
MCWQKQLDKSMQQLASDNKAPRIAILGIGSDLHCADAAGVMIARVLRQNALYSERLLVINAGIAPENKLGELRDFGPDLVLIIDAAYMNLEPGSVRFINPQMIDGLGFSTHTLPLRLLYSYITHEICMRVIILGIQPDDVSFQSALSPLVKESLQAILRALIMLLQPALQPAFDYCDQVGFPEQNFFSEANITCHPPENRSGR